MAHQIGMELCKKILKDEYEFVLSTHIDKGHIHNHIIFNNVNMVTGKCYQSNKKSYHQIRYQSDKLCRENNLSVIDEFYESYKKKHKTNGKSWYENEQAKRGTSWKSRLQFDIDRMIKQSKDWDEFLKKMAEERQGLQDKIKSIDKEMQELSATMEQVYTVKKYREYYKEHKANPSDAFFEEYKSQIVLYETALSELKKSHSKLPNSKDILDRLDNLQEKKNTLMKEYSSSKSTMDELYQIRKNYGIYMGKEMVR